MFKPEDFELSLEKKLRLQVIKKEVDECRDIDALRENIVALTEVFMKYQQLLNVVLAKQVEQNLAGLLSTMDEETQGFFKDA